MLRVQLHWLWDATALRSWRRLAPEGPLRRGRVRRRSRRWFAGRMLGEEREGSERQKLRDKVRLRAWGERGGREGDTHTHARTGGKDRVTHWSFWHLCFPPRSPPNLAPSWPVLAYLSPGQPRQFCLACVFLIQAHLAVSKASWRAAASETLHCEMRAKGALVPALGAVWLVWSRGQVTPRGGGGDGGSDGENAFSGPDPVLPRKGVRVGNGPGGERKRACPTGLVKGSWGGGGTPKNLIFVLPPEKRPVRTWEEPQVILEPIVVLTKRNKLRVVWPLVQGHTASWWLRN